MASQPRTTDNKLPLMLSSSDMAAAFGRGEVTPLFVLLNEFVRYADTWWMIDPPGWIRVRDEGLCSLLDQQLKEAATTIELPQRRASPRPTETS